MIKTIKVKKQLRLDELIKYVWDNVKGSCKFESTNGECIAEFDAFGKIQIIMRHFNYLHPSMVFTVEVEEKIDEDTFFEDITVVFESKSAYVTGHFYNSNLKKIKKAENLLSAYIPINGKLELIWEADSDEV